MLIKGKHVCGIYTIYIYMEAPVSFSKTGKPQKIITCKTIRYIYIRLINIRCRNSRYNNTIAFTAIAVTITVTITGLRKNHVRKVAKMEIKY